MSNTGDGRHTNSRGLGEVSALRLSECILLPHIRRAFPAVSPSSGIPFTPDTNPRLVSLTLTGIPPRSTGPVIEAITRFLDLAARQEHEIETARRSGLTGGGGSRDLHLLPGLRHIRLELEPDFDLNDGDEDEDEVEYDKLLDPGDDDFATEDSSFFDTYQDSSSSRGVQQQSFGNGSKLPSASTPQYKHWTSGRLKSYPYVSAQEVSLIQDLEDQEDAYQQQDPEHITYTIPARASLSGNLFTVPMWIGPGTIGPHAAVNEYMWNLAQMGEHRLGPFCSSSATGTGSDNNNDYDDGTRGDIDIGPATPSQVAAGVPPGSYVYNSAWNAVAFPERLFFDASYSALSPAVATTTVTGPGEQTSTRSIKKHITRLLREGKADKKPLLDVATAIKQYRVRTREQAAAATSAVIAAAGRGETAGKRTAVTGAGTESGGLHWGGRIELVTTDRDARYHASEYWR